MNTVYDVIIVGTGAAGLFCALNFPETKKVRLFFGPGRHMYAAG